MSTLAPLQRGVSEGYARTRIRLRGLPVSAAGIVLAALLALPGRSQAQEQCDYLDGTVNVESTDNGNTVRFTSPILSCDSDRIRVSSATAIGYTSQRRYEFFGRTQLENADVRLTATNAQYESATDRITAQGNVLLIKKADGDTIRGENLEYVPASDGVPERLIVTGGRPHAVLTPRSSAGGGAPGAPSTGSATSNESPYRIDADRITIEGNDFTGEGRVEIHRDSTEAYGNSVRYSDDLGQMTLTGAARLKTEENELTGGFILLEMPDGDIREAFVRDDARMTSERVQLSGPTLRIGLRDGEVEQLWAGRGPVQPADATATAPRTGPAAPAQPVLITDGYHVNADSLYIRAPAARLDTLRAMGRAKIVSLTADSLERAELPPPARTDWIEGDTVLAVFAKSDSSATAASAPTTTAADTTEANAQQLEVLRAWGDTARALYLMEPADTAAARRGERAVSYLKADTINVSFEDGEVKTLRGDGNMQGIQLEPPQNPRTDSVPPIPSTGTPAAGTPGAVPPAGPTIVPPPANNPNPGPPGPLSPRSPIRGPERHR